jgi:hypothetical protein
MNAQRAGRRSLVSEETLARNSDFSSPARCAFVATNAQRASYGADFT